MFAYVSLGICLQRYEGFTVTLIIFSNVSRPDRFMRDTRFQAPGPIQFPGIIGSGYFTVWTSSVKSVPELFLGFRVCAEHQPCWVWSIERRDRSCDVAERQLGRVPSNYSDRELYSCLIEDHGFVRTPIERDTRTHCHSRTHSLNYGYILTYSPSLLPLLSLSLLLYSFVALAVTVALFLLLYCVTCRPYAHDHSVAMLWCGWHSATGSAATAVGVTA